MIASTPAQQYVQRPEPPDDGKRRVTLIVLLFSAALALLGALLTH